MTYKQYLLNITAKSIPLDNTIDNRYHYVYRITNLKENKHYYGSRSSVCLPKDDLGIKYFSSIASEKYKWLIEDQKINKNDYKYKILKIFNNNRDKIVYESYLHSKFNVKNNKHFYNLSNQTPTGFNTNGVSGELHSLYGKPRDNLTKLKISSTLTNKYNKENHPNFGKKRPELALKTSGVNNPMYGKTHSDSTIELYRSTRKGSNNPRSKSINIYNADGTLIDTCTGNFKSVCYLKGYPLGAFQKALKYSSCVYSGTPLNKIINKQNHKFIGWTIIYS